LRPSPDRGSTSGRGSTRSGIELKHGVLRAFAAEHWEELPPVADDDEDDEDDQ
jgi:hypothetical protein